MMPLTIRLSTLLLSLLLLASCGDDGGLGLAEEFTRDVLAEPDIEYAQDELPPIPAGVYPDNARDDQIKALERANWYRYQSDLPPMDMIDAINKACQAHCDFYVTHIDKYQSTGFSPHNEDASWGNGFTGVAPWDRMGHFGYGDGAAEVIAFVHNPTLSVDGWMNTLYHRIPFMNATLTSCGYGAAGSGGWQNSSKIDTMDFGWSDASGAKYSGPVLEGVYPPPGSSGIPPSFDGMESPQPPVPQGGYPSGTIVSVTWSATANFAVEEHRIWKDGTTTDLPHVWVDPGNDANLAGANTIALYANAPLEKGTRYWVEIKGKKNGAEWHKKWFFITQRY
jgi:uncharacterized protein YkwD